MKNEVDIASSYKELTPLFSRLEEEAKFILGKVVAKKGIKLHSTQSRIKSIESLLAKAKRKTIDDPIGEMTDIVGIRLICLFRSDLDNLGDVIRSSFLVASEDNKIDEGDVSSFGYQSMHFVVKIKNEHSGPRYDDLRDKKFEIQIRTIAMDAWATISHYLDYKSANDTPSELRKDFYALSGLFYVADTHFELFYKSRASAKAEIQKELKQKGGILEEEINLDTVGAFLSEKFPDRKHGDSKAVSNLIDELAKTELKKIKEIDTLIDSVLDLFLEYEKEYPPNDVANSKYMDVGLVRGVLGIANESYIKNIHPTRPVGWDTRYSKYQMEFRNRTILKLGGI